MPIKRDKLGRFASGGASAGTKAIRGKQRVAATTRANLGAPSIPTIIGKARRTGSYSVGTSQIKHMRNTNTARVKVDNKDIAAGKMSSRYKSRKGK